MIPLIHFQAFGELLSCPMASEYSLRAAFGVSVLVGPCADKEHQVYRSNQKMCCPGCCSPVISKTSAMKVVAKDLPWKSYTLIAE